MLRFIVDVSEFDEVTFKYGKGSKSALVATLRVSF